MKNPLTGRLKEASPIADRTEESAPSVRLAVYDHMAALPRVVELSSANYQEFVELMANKTYELSHAKGGRIPFSVIREVVENLMHAYFEECVITILDDGNTIRVADQGPGIADKAAAFVPGFSTATGDMKRFIRGVGSGLPVAKEMLSVAGGKITIEDNLNQGAVVTLSLKKDAGPVAASAPETPPAAEASDTLELTDRQKKIIYLIMELGDVGPSKIAPELGASLSSAYRDLNHLEKVGLIRTTKNGRRTLSDRGVDYVETIGG